MIKIFLVVLLSKEMNIRADLSAACEAQKESVGSMVYRIELGYVPRAENVDCEWVEAKAAHWSEKTAPEPIVVRSLFQYEAPHQLQSATTETLRITP